MLLGGMSGSYISAKSLKSGPQNCIASALPAELSLQCQLKFIIIIIVIGGGGGGSSGSGSGGGGGTCAQLAGVSFLLLPCEFQGGGAEVLVASAFTCLAISPTSVLVC